jgi:hypothetical protein
MVFKVVRHFEISLQNGEFPLTAACRRETLLKLKAGDGEAFKARP